VRFDPRRILGLAFPPPPMQSRNYLAVRVTDAIDRDSLHQLLQRKRKNHTMSESTVLAIPQSARSGSTLDHVALRPVHEVGAPTAGAAPPAPRWGTPEHVKQRDADAAVAKELAAADEAATTSGTSFRDSMRRITELQSAEIERLRAIITDFTAERPRKPVSLAPHVDGNGRARGVVALADDATMWSASDLLAPGRVKWERIADLPQPTDAMGAE
jgi:hypothetical protein